ncbi:hypothetical protein HanIR_Chr02g0084411 [Helianthus annuus]|nr:hypothetical protein HanIR_Chr02g0084411 [Helianthus annuus]
MSSDWWGINSNTESKYTSKGLSPSWAEPLALSSSSVPSQASLVSTSQWAFVSNQNQSIQSILLSENETGSNNCPLKLTHTNEYPGWEDRFHTYILTIDNKYTCFFLLKGSMVIFVMFFYLGFISYLDIFLVLWNHLLVILSYIKSF